MKRKSAGLLAFNILDSIEENKESKKDMDMIFIKRHADSVVDHDIIMFGYLRKKSNIRYLQSNEI